MDYGEHLEALARESAALVRAAERAWPDAAVPPCPGWTMADLVAHMASGNWRVATLVETRSLEPLPREFPAETPATDQLLAWYRASTDQLLEVLAATEPGAPVWTFVPERSAAFWALRRANETAVHRWDAEQASGIGRPIAAPLAVDGIDETLEIFSRRGLVGDGETVHFHCTDADGEWLVRATPAGFEIDRVHAKGDVAVRGSASALDLYLWGRLPIDGFETFGDLAVLERVFDVSR